MVSGVNPNSETAEGRWEVQRLSRCLPVSSAPRATFSFLSFFCLSQHCLYQENVLFVGHTQLS